MRCTDDLILSCGGDYFSMFMMLRGFATFSGALGLLANQGKSGNFTGNVDNVTMVRIMRASGFRMGHLPFKYLGVLIS